MKIGTFIFNFMDNSIQPIKREECLISGKKDIVNLYTFKNFPVYISSTDSDPSEDIFLDMEWGYPEGGTVQLNKLVPPNILYDKHHNSGMVGTTWEKHHQIFFEFINKREIGNVLEIGGASGNLSKKFFNISDNVSWENIEPGKHSNTDTRVKLINEYFENYNFSKKYNTIVHSHVFEHIYEPIKFLKKVNEVLEDDGHHYISIPNMKHWLSNNYTNTLMFEHTFYVDEDVLETLLNITGFEVIDRLFNNHSIYICCKKVSPSADIKYDSEKIRDMFLKYVDFLISDIDKIKKDILGKKVYAFGAHIFTQMILNFGVDESNIISVLDNDKQKQGKRLYGTNLFIQSPAILGDEDEPIIILRCGSYTEEIRENLLKINKKIKFI